MEGKMNYQIKMEQILESVLKETKQQGRVPSLLLHGCCAPCSSYVLEYLSSYFSITLFYYNPNIEEETEYRKRIQEVKRLLQDLPVKYPVSLLEGPYEPERFAQAIAGKEHLGERSLRCYACYELRLRETARLAKQQGFDFFTTTLSISPYKNAAWLNEIGARLETEWDVGYLYADFKKRNGYQRSIQLSTQYQLYRQDFCGCGYSREEERQRKERENTKRGVVKE